MQQLKGTDTSAGPPQIVLVIIRSDAAAMVATISWRPLQLHQVQQQQGHSVKAESLTVNLTDWISALVALPF